MEFLDGETPAFHPVFIDYHRDPMEVFREHEWLVAGKLGVEE